jgi:hypothetical protein
MSQPAYSVRFYVRYRLLVRIAATLKPPGSYPQALW